MDFRAFVLVVFAAFSSAQAVQQKETRIEYNHKIAKKVEPVVVEECTEEDVQTCMDIMKPLLGSDYDEDNACDIMRETYECLLDEADWCLTGAARSAAQPELDRMKRRMTSVCMYYNKDKAVAEQCIRSEKSYLDECVIEGMLGAIKELWETDDGNTERVKCTSYILIAECKVERTDERCGIMAAKIMQDRAVVMPKVVISSCDSLHRFFGKPLQIN